ncbi:MAG: HepT-like ribonuclease domain-containing protein [Gaiellaceae bacterium]
MQLIREQGPADSPTLCGDDLLQAAMLRSLTLLGRVAKCVSPELRAAHPDVRWDMYAELGQSLVERYYEVDLDRVWHVIREDVPELERQVERILEGLG